MRTRFYKTATLVTGLSVAERTLGFLYRMILARMVGAEGLGVYQVALYPVIRKLIKMGNELQEVCVELSEEATADDYKEQYVKTLEYAVEESENVLALCNVMIESEGLEKFDGKKHRMLKAIKTEDPALNGVVAKKYCDCYSMDDKIIYPSKVDVYRV